MISILCETGTESTGHKVADAIQAGYAMPQSPELLTSDAVWKGTPSWDDLLIVVYKTQMLAPPAAAYIDAYRKSHPITDPATPGSTTPGGFVIPVATNQDAVRPPAPIDGIKAILFDDAPDTTRRLVDSVGAFLGMALRPGENQIFISYRATDGKIIAQDLYKRLAEAGLNPWLDEAREGKRENLFPGANVQDVIIGHLRFASMIVMVDSPDANNSWWVKAEIDTAIGDLIPVLPIVLGGEKAPRSPTLSGLRRWANAKTHGLDGNPITDDEWKDIHHEIVQFLMRTYRSRQNIESIAQDVFDKNKYTLMWTDKIHRMFESKRSFPGVGDRRVLSHCLIQDITHLATLKAYRQYLVKMREIADFQYKICLYDGDRVLSDLEFAAQDEIVGSLPFIRVHAQDLPILIESNFTTGRRL